MSVKEASEGIGRRADVCHWVKCVRLMQVSVRVLQRKGELS